MDTLVLEFPFSFWVLSSVCFQRKVRTERWELFHVQIHVGSHGGLGLGIPSIGVNQGRGFRDRWGAWCRWMDVTQIFLLKSHKLHISSPEIPWNPRKMPKHHPRSSVTSEFVVSENKWVSVGLWVMTLFLWIYNYPTYNCFLGPILWRDASKWDTFVAYGSLRSFFSESPVLLLETNPPFASKTTWVSKSFFFQEIFSWGVWQREQKIQKIIHHPGPSSINQQNKIQFQTKVPPPSQTKSVPTQNHFNQQCFFWVGRRHEGQFRQIHNLPLRFDSRALRAPRHRRCGRWTAGREG